MHAVDYCCSIDLLEEEVFQFSYALFILVSLKYLPSQFFLRVSAGNNNVLLSNIYLLYANGHTQIVPTLLQHIKNSHIAAGVINNCEDITNHP